MSQKGKASGAKEEKGTDYHGPLSMLSYVHHPSTQETKTHSRRKK